MGNNQITLIKRIPDGKDAQGNQKFKEIISTIFCQARALATQERTDRGLDLLAPAFNAVVSAFEYADQDQAEFHGRRYKVVGTYGGDGLSSALGRDQVELKLEGLSGDGPR